MVCRQSKGQEMVVDVYTLEIMKRYIRLPITRDIWKPLSKDFYDGADEL